jgi:peptide/nickel transport system substrate-binding protein
VRPKALSHQSKWWGIGIGTALAATLAAVLVASVAAATSSPSAATRVAKHGAASDTLVIAVPHDVETLDADFSHYPLANEVNYNLHAQYFIYGMKRAGSYSNEVVTQIKPKSIASWKLAPNGRSIVLNIQKGNTFCHTGNPVTADDYIYYFDRGIKTKSGYLFNIRGANIKSWQKLSPTSFRLNFSKPSPFFFYLFRDQSQGPIDSIEMKKQTTSDDPWATKWAAKHDAGSGPYCVSSWSPGSEMRLTANPGYKGPGKPAFKTVVLKVVPDATERALLLKEGTVDIAEGLTIDQVSSLRGASGIKVLDIPSRDQYEVGLNSKIKPFTSRLVRQALSYAVPYREIMNHVFGGHALLPKGAIPNRGQMFDPKTWPYTTNPAKAKALLAKAGYGNGFSFTLDINAGDAISQSLAVVLQSALKKIGVTMNINPQTAAIYAQRLDARKHQAFLQDLLWYVNDPAYIGSSFYGCTAILDWTSYCNKAVDKTIAQMLEAWRPSQHAAKVAAASKMQRLINADAPTLILAEPNLQIAMRSDLSGFVAAPDEETLYNYLRRTG